MPLPSLAEVASPSLDFNVGLLGRETWKCMKCRKRFHYSPHLPFYIIYAAHDELKMVCTQCYDAAKPK